MRIFTLLLLISFIYFSFGQDMTFEEWQKEAQQNIRLLPKYGGVKKNKQQKQADEALIKAVMKSFESRRAASNNMMEVGFKYLYKGDLKTAMYRFNQAYLLDSENSNIYLGFGVVYMTLKEFDLSRAQYKEGLKMDKNNEKLLIDYANTYIIEFYLNREDPDYLALLDKAIPLLLEAYSINPTNSNSSAKLAGTYLYKGDCETASEYINIAKKHGSQRVEELELELEEKCSEKPTDCTSLRTGTFILNDDITGETIIIRAKEFQIEINTELGYHMRFSITWIDECTYLLRAIEDLNNPESTELPTMVLTCKVTEITDKGYVQISSSNIDSAKFKHEIVRIK